jgi:hypothetical protein
LEIKREGPALVVRPSGGIVLGSHTSGWSFSGGVLRVPLPAVEAGYPQALPEPGATTQQMKVLDQQYSGNALTLRLAGMAGSHQIIDLRVNDPRAKVHIEGAGTVEQPGSSLRFVQIDFGTGDGYVEKTVRFTW